MKPASVKRGAQAKKSAPSTYKKYWTPKPKPKEEKPKEPIVLCRIIPPVVALIPDLLDTPVPSNYTPEQAIELLNLKIRNRLLL